MKPSVHVVEQTGIKRLAGLLLGPIRPMAVFFVCFCFGVQIQIVFHISYYMHIDFLKLNFSLISLGLFFSPARPLLEIITLMY